MDRKFDNAGGEIMNEEAKRILEGEVNLEYIHKLLEMMKKISEQLEYLIEILE